MSHIITIYQIIEIIVKILLLLIAIAYFTIAERKAMAAIQRRRGPNIVGPFGLLQPLADGLKLLVKQMILPTRANKLIFVFAPVAILTLSLVSWSLIPFNNINKDEYCTMLPMVISEYCELNKNIQLNLEFLNILGVSKFYYTLFFLLALSSLNVYSIIIAGWSSNSKYAFLGSLRSAAQMISYEVSIGLVLLPVVFLSSSLNLTEIVLKQGITGWYFFPLLPCAIIFFISMLAETNRTPFDLPEAEAELVAGYNVEYGSLIFAMFFLGEYSNMLLMSTLISILFFGGWISSIWFLSPELILAFKLSLFCFSFILVRATLPRYKYNQLMDIGWKIFLPMMLAFFFFIIVVISFTDFLLNWPQPCKEIYIYYVSPPCLDCWHVYVHQPCMEFSDLDIYLPCLDCYNNIGVTPTLEGNLPCLECNSVNTPECIECNIKDTIKPESECVECNIKNTTKPECIECNNK